MYFPEVYMKSLMKKWGMLCCLIGLVGCHSESKDDSRLYHPSIVGQTKTLEVPGAYSTIQQAINAAGKGDFIRVASGAYQENLTITNQNFGLRGAGIGQTILQGSIEIYDSSETSVEGVTLQGGGIYVKNSPVRITGNEIYGSPIAGVWVEHAEAVVLSDNLVHDNGQEGILFDDAHGVIGSNSVTNNATDGVVVSNSSPTVLDNTVTGNGRDGISIRGFTAYSAPLLLTNTSQQNGGVSNYDIICFGGNTNPTGSGNIFDRCINCGECRTFGNPLTYEN